ncbi:MAG: sensor histidine kinase [Bdellovibrionota bacterium]|nr:sensor histidine kinase [Bdellovibrionota bacterium]
MSKTTLSFKDFLSKKLLPYRIAIPMALSIITAIFTAYSLLVFYSSSDQSFIKAIAPHVSTLIETQDRPELQRFINSVAKEKLVQIDIVQTDSIIATSGDTTLIGKNRIDYGRSIFGIDSKLSITNLISKEVVKRENGPQNLKAKIILYNPTTTLLSLVIAVSILVFILIFLVLNIFASRIIQTAQKSIEPIQELEKRIYGLNDFEELEFESNQRIKELENIHNAIISTNTKLKESNDRLAETKAKELTINAYKKLIHDLHTPVAALKQMTKIINKDNIPQNKKDFAKTRVSEIAEQILYQVKASKGNLKVEVKSEDFNLKESVTRATGQAQMAMANYENIEVVEKFDSAIKELAHDNMMLGRAISNLVVNAIEEAKSIVEVAVNKIGKEVSITVSDDGKGIKEEMVSLYLQGRGKSNKKNGLGIGLSSANHIVRLHGGSITYRNSHLGGACFDIRLQG